MFKISRVGCGLVWSGLVGSGRVGSGRVGSGRVGSGRVGSGGFQNLAGRVGSSRVRKFLKSRGSGRVGSGQDVSNFSRVGSVRVGSRRLDIFTDPTRPDPRDFTRPVKSPANFVVNFVKDLPASGGCSALKAHLSRPVTVSSAPQCTLTCVNSSITRRIVNPEICPATPTLPFGRRHVTRSPLYATVDWNVSSNSMSEDNQYIHSLGDRSSQQMCHLEWLPGKLAKAPPPSLVLLNVSFLYENHQQNAELSSILGLS